LASAFIRNRLDNIALRGQVDDNPSLYFKNKQWNDYSQQRAFATIPKIADLLNVGRFSIAFSDGKTEDQLICVQLVQGVPNPLAGTLQEPAIKWKIKDNRNDSEESVAI